MFQPLLISYAELWTLVVDYKTACLSKSFKTTECILWRGSCGHIWTIWPQNDNFVKLIKTRTLSRCMCYNMTFSNIFLVHQSMIGASILPWVCICKRWKEWSNITQETMVQNRAEKITHRETLLLPRFHNMAAQMYTNSGVKTLRQAIWHASFLAPATRSENSTDQKQRVQHLPQKSNIQHNSEAIHSTTS